MEMAAAVVVAEAMAAAMVETTIIKDRPNGGRERDTERSARDMMSRIDDESDITQIIVVILTCDMQHNNKNNKAKL